MKKYDDFLKKIGITLPEPRVMEGFGMEFPTVYLDRCMEVIVPATEEFLRKQLQLQQDVIIEDFMNYVRQYKGLNVSKETKSSNTTISAEQIVADVTEGVQDSLKKIFPYGKNLVVNSALVDTINNNDALKENSSEEINNKEEDFAEDVEEDNSDSSHRTHLKRADQYTAVYEFFQKNPLATREDCVQALGISMNTLGRRLRDLYFDKEFSPAIAGYKPRGLDDEKMQKDLQILRDYISEHPNAYKLDFMRNLKLRRDELDIYLRILSKEGIYTERSVKRDVSMPIDTEKDKVTTLEKSDKVVEEPVVENNTVESKVALTNCKETNTDEKKVVKTNKEEQKPLQEAKPKKISNHNRKEIFKYENPTSQKTSYKEGGYMAGIRRRFEASNRTSLKHSSSDNFFTTVVLKECFDSLPNDVKNRAVMEHWDSALADYDTVSELESGLSKMGLHLVKNKLSKMEHYMLNNALTKKDVSTNDLLTRYADYVKK